LNCPWSLPTVWFNVLIRPLLDSLPCCADFNIYKYASALVPYGLPTFFRNDNFILNLVSRFVAGTSGRAV
jgi:hypothetical protein